VPLSAPAACGRLKRGHTAELWRPCRRTYCPNGMVGRSGIGCRSVSVPILYNDVICRTVPSTSSCHPAAGAEPGDRRPGSRVESGHDGSMRGRGANYWVSVAAVTTSPTNHSGGANIHPVYSILTYYRLQAAPAHNTQATVLVQPVLQRPRRYRPELVRGLYTVPPGTTSPMCRSGLQNHDQVRQWTKATTGSASAGAAVIDCAASETGSPWPKSLSATTPWPRIIAGRSIGSPAAGNRTRRRRSEISSQCAKDCRQSERGQRRVDSAVPLQYRP